MKWAEEEKHHESKRRENNAIKNAFDGLTIGLEVILTKVFRIDNRLQITYSESSKNTKMIEKKTIKSPLLGISFQNRKSKAMSTSWKGPEEKTNINYRAPGVRTIRFIFIKYSSKKTVEWNIYHVKRSKPTIHHPV